MIHQHRNHLDPKTAERFYVDQATIDATHPMDDASPEGACSADEAAMVLVGERHEKRDLVNLVRTLLLQREKWMLHSVALNRASWALAAAMGDVAACDDAAQIDIDMLVARVIARITTPSVQDVDGWIVGNSDQTRWRAWDETGPIWVESRDAATRYARREDAESVHREDEDAWSIQSYRRADDVTLLTLSNGFQVPIVRETEGYSCKWVLAQPAQPTTAQPAPPPAEKVPVARDLIQSCIQTLFSISEGRANIYASLAEELKAALVHPAAPAPTDTVPLPRHNIQNLRACATLLRHSDNLIDRREGTVLLEIANRLIL